jgi:hypothetical protein
MDGNSSQFFSGIFDRDAPGQAGVFTWQFREPDLNESADRMFAHLDRLIEETRRRGYVLLNTIELDVEAGRFPDVVAAYFSLPGWDYRKRFFVASMFKGVPEELYTVGRLTFEVEVGQTAQVLAQNGGFRWGTNLSVGGVQVPESAVASALRLCPFDPKDAAMLQDVARFAWAAGRDLDEMAVWLPVPEDHLRERLSALA